jgi:hypothetical protein
MVDESAEAHVVSRTEAVKRLLRKPRPTGAASPCSRCYPVDTLPASPLAPDRQEGRLSGLLKTLSATRPVLDQSWTKCLGKHGERA